MKLPLDYTPGIQEARLLNISLRRSFVHLYTKFGVHIKKEIKQTTNPHIVWNKDKFSNSNSKSNSHSSHSKSTVVMLAINHTYQYKHY